jgi:hypothetical protein
VHPRPFVLSDDHFGAGGGSGRSLSIYGPQPTQQTQTQTQVATEKHRSDVQIDDTAYMPYHRMPSLGVPSSGGYGYEGVYDKCPGGRRGSSDAGDTELQPEGRLWRYLDNIASSKKSLSEIVSDCGSYQYS